MVVPGFQSTNGAREKVCQFNVKSLLFEASMPIQSCKHLRTEDMLFIAPRELYKIVDQQTFQFVEMDEAGQPERRDIMDVVMAYNQKHWNTDKYRWLEQEIKQLRVTN